MKVFFKQLFCRHYKHENEVICWHWVHFPNSYDIRSVEAQLYCKHCGKYHFLHIFDWSDCYVFIEKHREKQWSGRCRPILDPKEQKERHVNE